MLAFKWSEFPNINDIHRDIDEADNACLADIAKILKAHGKEWRFGVNLLHSHFEISDDEILLETNDPIDKSLWIRPVPKAEFEGGRVSATAWCLADGAESMNCFCRIDNGQHIGHVHQR